MAQHIHEPIQFLSALRRQVLQTGSLPASELPALVRLCAHSVETVREAALVLLLHPPIEDELAHAIDLMVTSHNHLSRLPEALRLALFDLACDLIAACEGLPGTPPLRTALDHVLNRCSRSAAQRVMAGRLLLDQLEPRFLRRLVITVSGGHSNPLKSKVRILIKRCQHHLPAWAAPTTADLQPLRHNPRTGRIHRLTRGRWLRVCRAMTTSVDPVWDATTHSTCGSPDLLSNGRSQASYPRFAMAPEPPPAAKVMSGTHDRHSDRLPARAKAHRWMPTASGLSRDDETALLGGPESRLGSRPSYWGGYGPAALRYLDRLIQLQAQEIAAQRALARRVGIHTGRVVLSLHNATLAAMGGWGFDPLTESFRDERQRRTFIEGVIAEERRIAAVACRSRNGLDDILRLRFKRLIQPKLVQAVREMELRSRLDPRFILELQQLSETAARFAAHLGLSTAPEADPHTLSGAVAPHQKRAPSCLIQWASDQLHLWKPGFVRLAVLLGRGQASIDRNEIPCFTVPWIDKFFISSRRDKDLAFLPALIRWLENRGIRPLVLFWEDTAHASNPSFQLALEQMNAAGARFRGIGVFAADGSRRTDAERIILKEHATTSLFALRPQADTHLPRSFDQLLGELDPRLFVSYDSAWKDNLALLYFGTRVSSLLSSQSVMEAYSPWVILQGRKRPFGAWLRQKLRHMLLGEMVPRQGAFWGSYMRWANLD